MLMLRRAATDFRALLLAGLVASTLPVATTAARAQGIPARIGDVEFWQMMTTLSEPSGYFPSENLLSNETGFQAILPALTRAVRPGGVYLGVGPEQNFTYVVALHPAIAFIIDIRHQNAMQHLLYKALIELSDSRADFLANLFSRPRPPGLDSATTVDSLFASYGNVAPDSVMHDRTLAAIRQRLLQQHGFALDSGELQLLEHNFDAFYQAGPGLSYRFGASGGGGGFGGRGRMPTYADLMVLTDGDSVQRSYLATEANFRTLRDLESRNLIVPLTGDFSGPKVLRAVGDYVRQHGATVTTFYTSNVEQYLFRQGDQWSRFYQNVATLPLDSTSTFIRSGGFGGRGMGGGGGMRSSRLESMLELVQAFHDGKIQAYADVLQLSH